jgi:hypothetical protein
MDWVALGAKFPFMSSLTATSKRAPASQAAPICGVLVRWTWRKGGGEDVP